MSITADRSQSRFEATKGKIAKQKNVLSGLRDSLTKTENEITKIQATLNVLTDGILAYNTAVADLPRLKGTEADPTNPEAAQVLANAVAAAEATIADGKAKGFDAGLGGLSIEVELTNDLRATKELATEMVAGVAKAESNLAQLQATADAQEAAHLRRMIAYPTRLASHLARAVHHGFSDQKNRTKQHVRDARNAAKDVATDAGKLATALRGDA